MTVRSTLARITTAVAIAAVAALPQVAGAQAYAYPSFQQPRITPREYNFGIADGGSAGTALVFQWREGMSAKQQLSLDVGIADPDYRDSKNVFFIGGQLAQQLTTASADMPLDLLFTAGLNGAFGDNTSLFRIPVGVSLGHRFPLEGSMAITPYVHPRASIDFLRFDGPFGGRESDTEVNIDFDIGASFEFTTSLALRASAGFGGGNSIASDDSFGISLAYTPRGLRR